MNDGRQAEGLIFQVIQPDFQEELSHLGGNRFFREAFSAFVRAINSFVFLRGALDDGVAVVNQLNLDVEVVQARAEAAERALESAKADCSNKMKEAENRVEVACRREQAALSQLADAESAIEARNLHISDLKAATQAAEDRAKEVEEEARVAKEEAQLARKEARLAKEEARLAKEAEGTAKASLAEKETRIAEVEAAAEAKVAAAVEEYRASESFTQEMVEANVDCFFQGFTKAKEKIAQVLDFPRALEIVPDTDSEGSSDAES